jgi:hypothetical protein
MLMQKKHRHMHLSWMDARISLLTPIDASGGLD